MLIVGIDPDLKKSGFAVYRKQCQTWVKITSLPIWELFSEFKLIYDFEHIVYIEHSSKNCVWHGGGVKTNINVGKNKAVAQIIIDFCEAHGINYKTVEPAGYSKLFDDVSVFEKNTAWKERTNKDARAAAAIVFSKI